jgi:hypothetical protein
MAIEDDDIRDREMWTEVAGTPKHPTKTRRQADCVTIRQSWQRISAIVLLREISLRRCSLYLSSLFDLVLNAENH